MSAMVMRFDEWPIVLIEPPGHAVSEEVLSRALAEYTAAVNLRHGSFATLCDLGDRIGLTPPQRRMLAESLSRDDAAAKRCVAQAVVIRVPVARHMFTAVLWMSQPAFPVRVFSNIEEARIWLRAQFPRAVSTRPIAAR